MADYQSQFSGSEIDARLAKVPTLETNLSELTERVGTDETAIGDKVDKVPGKGLSTNDYTTSEKNKLGALPTNPYVKPSGGIPASDLASGVIPDVSQFITRSVNDLVNYYLKSDTYTKQEVQALIAAINQFHYEVYESLSDVTSPASNVLYLIGPTGSGSDKYEEYVWPNATLGFVKIGDTSIDLSGYVTTTALNSALANYTTTADLTSLLAAKAARDTNATEGNLAKFDANGNPVDSGEKIGDFAKKDGYYEGMTAGLAENLIDTKGQGTEQSFTRRTSCGNDSISDDGSALIKKLMGNSLVFNQLLNTPRGSTTTINGITFTNNNDGSVSVGGTASDDVGFEVRYKSNFFNGHKYLFKGCPKGGSTSSYKLYVSGDLDMGNGIIENRADGALNMQIQVSNGTVISTPIKFWPQIIDLTLMFGAGNEPSTVSEFEALFNKPYYAYNAGQIIDNKVEEYQTVGFNQWDEEWELGGINDSTGEKNSATTQIRSKNFIPVLPGTVYYFVGPGTYSYLYEYDANKNYLGRVNSGGVSLLSTSFTTRSNTRFLMMKSNVTTYNHDICINLSWSGYRNGEYEPYWKNSLPLGLNSFKVTDGTNEITVTGLKSAGTVYDEINLVRKKYIKRVGSVDLGTLSWDYSSTYGFFSTGIHDEVNAGDNSVAYNLICSNFIAMARRKLTTSNNGIAITDSKAIAASSTMTDSAAFKTAMSGVILYYELAEPIEYDLVDEIQTIAPCADFGTEHASPTEEVDANGVPKSAPFRAQIKYSDDFTRILARRNQDLQNQESMDAFVSMLGGVLNGTITKTWDATNKKYTYSFTANE